MNINEIKDLMAQFDQSSLREFSYKNQQNYTAGGVLLFCQHYILRMFQ